MYIVLNINLVEGKQLDALKSWRDEVGATTAVTLRLCEPWKGTGRTVIGDSWFGSCNTAEWLMDTLGLHSILAVKTGHAGYPKAAMIAAVEGERFKSHFKKIDVELDTGVRTFYAGAHMDKKPMLLVSTCGTSLPGETIKRDHREFVDNEVLRTTYNCT